VKRCAAHNNPVTVTNKNSSDEIANVNFFMTILHTYFKISKKITYFV